MQIPPMRMQHFENVRKFYGKKKLSSVMPDPQTCLHQRVTQNSAVDNIYSSTLRVEVKYMKKLGERFLRGVITFKVLH